MMTQRRHAMAIPHCIDCRCFDLTLDLKRGSYYYCTRKRQRLSYGLIYREPCPQFEPQPPVEHWGP
ncbi:MAG: hypothetical protein HY552_03845 [Elusimicrobia bacterium]|nr:hypothetical protein [Elusimicrobiota bacterium]